MNSYSKIVKPNINELISQHTNLVKKISWHLHGRVNSIIDIEDVVKILIDFIFIIGVWFMMQTKFMVQY